MRDPRDFVPAYRMIRVGVLEDPAAVLADEEGWRAHEQYPAIQFAGPMFGVAREREHGGWVLHPYFSAPAPQEARDSMGSHFRRLAHEAGQAGDQAGQAEYLHAAQRLEWEALDGMTAAGTRYQVVRTDQFIRSGPAGPEPPRPTDPDPGEPDLSHELPDPADGFVIDPAAPTGMTEGIVRLELLEAVYPEGAALPEVRADSLRAARTHPGGVLLPTAFTTAERAGGCWQPARTGTSPTPQGARDDLAGYLRVTAPWELRLGEQERAAYAAAADRLDEGRSNGLVVAGRRFRVVRVERLMRIGPDGPEGPRPSDPDPYPPVMVQTRQLGGQHKLTSKDEDAPIGLDEDARRFLQLFHEEEERRKERLEKRRQRESP